MTFAAAMGPSLSPLPNTVAVRVGACADIGVAEAFALALDGTLATTDLAPVARATVAPGVEGGAVAVGAEELDAGPVRAAETSVPLPRSAHFGRSEVTVSKPAEPRVDGPSATLWTADVLPATSPVPAAIPLAAINDAFAAPDSPEPEGAPASLKLPAAVASTSTGPDLAGAAPLEAAVRQGRAVQRALSHETESMAVLAAAVSTSTPATKRAFTETADLETAVAARAVHPAAAAQAAPAPALVGIEPTAAPSAARVARGTPFAQPALVAALSDDAAVELPRSDARQSEIDTIDSVAADAAPAPGMAKSATMFAMRVNGPVIGPEMPELPTVVDAGIAAAPDQPPMADFPAKPRTRARLSPTQFAVKPAMRERPEGGPSIPVAQTVPTAPALRVASGPTDTSHPPKIRADDRAIVDRSVGDAASPATNAGPANGQMPAIPTAPVLDPGPRLVVPLPVDLAPRSIAGYAAPALRQPAPEAQLPRSVPAPVASPATATPPVAEPTKPETISTAPARGMQIVVSAVRAEVTLPLMHNASEASLPHLTAVPDVSPAPPTPPIAQAAEPEKMSPAPLRSAQILASAVRPEASPPSMRDAPEAPLPPVVSAPSILPATATPPIAQPTAPPSMAPTPAQGAQIAASAVPPEIAERPSHGPASVDGGQPVRTAYPAVVAHGRAGGSRSVPAEALEGGDRITVLPSTLAAQVVPVVPVLEPGPAVVAVPVSLADRGLAADAAIPSRMPMQAARPVPPHPAQTAMVAPPQVLEDAAVPTPLAFASVGGVEAETFMTPGIGPAESAESAQPQEVAEPAAVSAAPVRLDLAVAEAGTVQASWIGPVAVAPVVVSQPVEGSDDARVSRSIAPVRELSSTAPRPLVAPSNPVDARRTGSPVASGDPSTADERTAPDGRLQVTEAAPAAKPKAAKGVALAGAGSDPGEKVQPDGFVVPQATDPVSAASAPSRAMATPVVRPAAVADMPVVVAQPGRIGHDMGVAIVHRLSAGEQELVVRLEPAALGRIEVRMAFDDQGGLRAVIAADSPVALDMLRRDSADLSRALNDAGIRNDGQSLRFQTDGNGGGHTGGQPRNPWLSGDRAADRSTADRGVTDDPLPYRQVRLGGRYDLMA